MDGIETGIDVEASEIEAGEIENNGIKGNIGFDSLLGDIFGLNLRMFGTVLTSFAAPKKLMLDAQEPYKEGGYTPAIRAWFSLFALMMVLRFLWAGPDSFMIDSMTLQMQGMPPAIMENSGKSLDEIVEIAINMTFAIWPFTGLFCLALAGFTSRMGKGVKLAQKARYAYMIQLPNMTVTIFLIIFTGQFLKIGDTSLLAILMLFGPMCVTLLLDTITARRTVYSGKKWGSLKALVLSLWFAFFVILSTSLSSMLAGIYIGVRFG